MCFDSIYMYICKSWASLCVCKKISFLFYTCSFVAQLARELVCVRTVKHAYLLLPLQLFVHVSTTCSRAFYTSMYVSVYVLMFVNHSTRYATKISARSGWVVWTASCEARIIVVVDHVHSCTAICGTSKWTWQQWCVAPAHTTVTRIVLIKCTHCASAVCLKIYIRSTQRRLCRVVC